MPTKISKLYPDSQGRDPEAPTSLSSLSPSGTQGKMVTTLSLLCQGSRMYSVAEDGLTVLI